MQHVWREKVVKMQNGMGFCATVTVLFETNGHKTELREEVSDQDKKQALALARTAMNENCEYLRLKAR